jgi:hypothetical protein
MADVENRIFVIEIFVNIRNGQKGEFGGQPPELALLTVLEYLIFVNISTRKFDSPRLPYVRFCLWLAKYTGL